MKREVPTMADLAHKNAWGEDYWTNDDFPDFLRWYARTDRYNADPTIGVNDIIDIIEKPWIKSNRKLYEEYLLNYKYKGGIS
tara:strand:- start:1073 stop:1318 length:246 start_codon:yes stop_codon:yes gene_type:complete